MPKPSVALGEPAAGSRKAGGGQRARPGLTQKEASCTGAGWAGPEAEVRHPGSVRGKAE